MVASGSVSGGPVGVCVARARALPGVLRGLHGVEDAVERAVEIGDELLADLDVLLAVCVRSSRRDGGLIGVAEQVLRLKWLVYCALQGFFVHCGWGDAALRGWEASAKRDLADSRARIDRALVVAPTVVLSRSAALGGAL